MYQRIRPCRLNESSDSEVLRSVQSGGTNNQPPVVPVHSTAGERLELVGLGTVQYTDTAVSDTVAYGTRPCRFVTVSRIALGWYGTVLVEYGRIRRIRGLP